MFALQRVAELGSLTSESYWQLSISERSDELCLPSTERLRLSNNNNVVDDRLSFPPQRSGGGGSGGGRKMTARKRRDRVCCLEQLLRVSQNSSNKQTLVERKLPLFKWFQNYLLSYGRRARSKYKLVRYIVACHLSRQTKEKLCWLKVTARPKRFLANATGSLLVEEPTLTGCLRRSGLQMVREEQIQFL